MTLNWTPEVVVVFITTGILLFSAVLTYTSPRTKKILSVTYFRTALIFISLFFLFEGISILFLNLAITRIYTLFNAVGTIFFLIGISHTMKESLKSIGLMVVVILLALLLYLTFQSEVAVIVVEAGYITTKIIGFYSIIGDVLFSIAFIYIFYWGIKTYRNAPFLIKTEATIFFCGIILSSIISLTVNMFYYINPIFILITDLIFSVGIFIFTYSIIKEPKLLYILPFEINRIIVKDRDGFPLFDHDWSESKINDSMFTGFINAVQLMSEEVIHKGGLLDIILTDGILMLRESEFITVGLVASKSSKLLRNSLVNFANDFEDQFKNLLKVSCRDIEKYDGAYELLDNYFSNFPSKLISSKSDPLYLIAKYKEIPPELENKLKSIATDEYDYEKIKEEIKKFPDCVPLHFMEFYEDIKERLGFKDENELPDKTQE